MITLRSGPLQRLAEIPVVKSGLSLVASTGTTAGLGLVFWMLAARLYTKEDFGVASTAVTTMMMLADVSLLGLRTGLVRFVPGAGSRTGALIASAYGVAAGLAGVAALIFLGGLGLWAPELSGLRDTAVLAVIFVTAAAAWAVFMLQDSALVGLHRAPWIPIENALFGLAKIALLLPLARVAPTYGLFLAWALPVFSSIVAINILVRREVQVRPDASDGRVQRTRNDMFRYSLADWTASFARLATYGVPPLLVLGSLGRAHAGYFNVAWLMAFTTFLISTNVADALLAESSYEQDQLNRTTRQALVLSMALAVPAALVGLVAAPFILQLFQPGAAEHATPLLRVLLVAAVPNVLVQIGIGRLRAQERMRLVIVAETVLAVVVLGLAVALLGPFGLLGVGWAWLLGLTVVGCGLVASEGRHWLKDAEPSSLGSGEPETRALEAMV